MRRRNDLLLSGDSDLFIARLAAVVVIIMIITSVIVFNLK
jgi:hypothetical protein